jgi:HSP20 family molecular chaperone IbpA
MQLDEEYNIVSQKDYDAFIDNLMCSIDQTYSPINIKRISETKTILQILVAGFNEEQVVVSVKDEILTIAANNHVINEENVRYILENIDRTFHETFLISSYMEVESAKYADGILSVCITYKNPEVKNAKEIPIARGGSQYLKG